MYRWKINWHQLKMLLRFGEFSALSCLSPVSYFIYKNVFGIVLFYKTLCTVFIPPNVLMYFIVNMNTVN